MTIDIKGHSGCDIDIIEIDGNLYVKKSTNDPKYLKRLYLQGNKQMNDIALCGSIVNPQIYELVQNDKEAYILMDYIYAKNFIDYFENASPEDINHFIDTFIKYINKELESCEIKSVDKKVFIDKFNSVKKNCDNNKLTNDNKKVKLILDACEAKFNQLPENINLPCNICHGDLTFSNILFTSNKYYFIDYLDSFIETPIQDIVKLRQDTKYFWYTKMYSKRYDIVRLNMIFAYIDNKINNYFSEYNEYYAQYYETLQIMNILRILPYVKKESVRDFVLNILSSFVGV